MSILVSEARVGAGEGAGGVGGVARRKAGPSVREVCLIGVARPSARWASGERLEWGGRVYRVSATQDRPDGRERAPCPVACPGLDDATHYVFLTAAAGEPAGAHALGLGRAG